MTLAWLSGALLGLIVLATVLVLAWRRHRLGRNFVGITVLLACAWSFAKWAVERDYRDADGYVDCWPQCTALQKSVMLGFGFAPVAWIVLGLLAAVLAAVSGPRGREWSSAETPAGRPTSSRPDA